jgi:hypothetical protein
MPGAGTEYQINCIVTVFFSFIYAGVFIRRLLVIVSYLLLIRGIRLHCGFKSFAIAFLFILQVCGVPPSCKVFSKPSFSCLIT